AQNERVTLAALGILLGLGMATKIYAYLALPLCAGMAGLVIWLRPRVHSAARPRPSRRSFLQAIEAALWIVTPAVVLVLPLWLRNVQLYGAWDILGLGFHDRVVVGQPTTANWLDQYGWVPYSERALTFTFRSFWGVFGWLSVFMDSPIYLMLQVF